jgi:hypothetical protein
VTASASAHASSASTLASRRSIRRALGFMGAGPLARSVCPVASNPVGGPPCSHRRSCGRPAAGSCLCLRRLALGYRHASPWRAAVRGTQTDGAPVCSSVMAQSSRKRDTKTVLRVPVPDIGLPFEVQSAVSSAGTFPTERRCSSGLVVNA